MPPQKGVESVLVECEHLRERMEKMEERFEKSEDKIGRVDSKVDAAIFGHHNRIADLEWWKRAQMWALSIFGSLFLLVAPALASWVVGEIHKTQTLIQQAPSVRATVP